MTEGGGKSALGTGAKIGAMEWVGLACVVSSAMLSARLIWEQTALTLRNGPQMVGFSLAHGPGVLLLLGPIGGIIWALTTLIVIARKKSWRNPIRLGLLVAFCLCVLLMAVPYGFWQRILVRAHAHGNFVGEFVSYAAATGDLETVKSFVAEGVPVDVRNERNRETPLHGAAGGGERVVVEYLLSKGANVNALDAYGDSPLERARSTNHSEVVAVLAAHGGKEVRGSEEEREQAIKAEVDSDMRRMQRDR
ncbi:MAG TPA: ankyrin repeat domain-containing protein [Steroidobacteraceae bacterium]|jgi:hypothetical protein